MSDQCSGTCCLAEASWSNESCLNWSLHTHSRACCLTILSLRNKHLCTQSWWLISAQQSQCRTPTWKYLLTPMLWKPRKSSVSASLPAPALATHIFSEPPNSIKSSAISSERGNSKVLFPQSGTLSISAVTVLPCTEGIACSVHLLLLSCCCFAGSARGEFLHGCCWQVGRQASPSSSCSFSHGSPAHKENHTSNQEKLWS